MNRRKFILSSAGALLIFFSSRKISWANKAEAKIEAPESTPQGSEITIRVTVIHSANNFFHHIEWLWIKVNENEIARWDFTGSNKPEGDTFTREIKYKTVGDAEIKAKASCNLHGSAGEATMKVLAKE
jgi:desulfoferrodoxin (superoxide reductase-like protein)